MVAAALARHSRALLPRSGPRPDRAPVSVLVTVVVAHPAERIVGILVTAFGHQVQYVVGAVQHLDATGIARVGVENGAAPVLVEPAGGLAVRHASVRRGVVVEHRATRGAVDGPLTDLAQFRLQCPPSPPTFRTCPRPL